MASIIVVAGPREGDYYPIEKRTVVVGRDAKCPIQIVDEKISRVHLEIAYDQTTGSHVARDLKSVNGVLLNGRHLRADSALANGDVLELGVSKLAYFKRSFPDRASAWDFYKISGERERGTLLG